ncbi:protein FAR1-RELATED SEQUENCE 5-like [Bidens hawaiensis]|uniref:protein FAR1-RELATED SEQUENCE 5-like n=1 Tax=Bidens hawaiensis TaxID=980011 RepID=UPI00404BA234
MASEVLSSNGNYHCHVCDVLVSGADNIDKHKNGRKHLSMIKTNEVFATIGDEKKLEMLEEGKCTDVINYFDSVAELVDWVKKTGREHGCVISVQCSRERSVELVCNRGGEPKLKGTVRHTWSIKRGCPFKLVGRYNVPGDCWKVKVVNETHNHDPVLFEEGHPTLRKLTDEEIDMVATLHRQGLRPTKIKSALKKSFPGNKCITMDINNVVKVLRDQNKIGDTPCKYLLSEYYYFVLEDFLQTHGFTFYTWENPSTNRTENVFFSHEKSHTMWREFPDLLLIDTTYNTNMYKCPFVQFVGVTSTSKCFCIAHAVNFREQECNFTWALERLKDMLVDCREPRVILTDRDQALMNACETVFPNATKNLCRWHITQNIQRKHKSLFQDDISKSFNYWWKVLYESPTKSMYDYNCGQMEAALARLGVIFATTGWYPTKRSSCRAGFMTD